jgi:hypothetical protein
MAIKSVVTLSVITEQISCQNKIKLGGCNSQNLCYTIDSEGETTTTTTTKTKVRKTKRGVAKPKTCDRISLSETHTPTRSQTCFRQKMLKQKRYVKCSATKESTLWTCLLDIRALGQKTARVRQLSTPMENARLSMDRIASSDASQRLKRHYTPKRGQSDNET